MKKKGFTLIELLSVIIVITIISLITVPVIINVIETSKKASFKDSVLIAYRSIDLKLYELKVDQMPDEGLEVKDLSIKSNFKSGKFLKNEEGKTISYFITDGEYCAYGEIRDLKIEKGCKNLDITVPILDESKLIITSKSSEIRINILEGFAIDNESGIENYIINLYKGDNLIDSKELTEIGEVVFNKLTLNTKYKIEIKVGNKKGLEESLTKTIETKKIEVPTYSVAPNGWSQSKTVTINYPTGYTNEYSIDSGLTWNKYTNPITFTSNATVIGRVTDGTNYVTGSSQTITQVDPTSPTSSTFTYTKTSNSISIVATGVDNESGILYYQYSKDNGTTWTNVQTGNKYTYSNLTNATYNIKVRVLNGTYINGVSGSYLDSSVQDVATVSLTSPTYSVTPSGWSQSKTVTINYPNGYTNEYSIDSGVTWKAYTGAIKFTNNGTVIGRVTDGTNYVTGSSQTVTQIDPTPPTSATFTYTKTSKSISITATGIDNESGILYYQYSKDNGASWTNVQTGNTYTYSNLSNATYNIKVRVLNGTYVNGVEGSYLDSASQSVLIANAESLKIAVSKSAIKINETIQVTSTITPSNTIDKTITWKSSNSNIATVSSTGLVKGISNGTVTITGTTANGISSTISLDIYKQYNITNIVLNGGYENGANNLSIVNAEIVSNVKYSGNYSLRLNKRPSDYVGNIFHCESHQAAQTSPIYNHQYYGSVMLLTSSTYSVADNRFELIKYNTGNEVNGKNRLIFAFKSDKTTVWLKKSVIQTLSYPDYSNASEWFIRNFIVNATSDIYTDDLLIIDLTATFGIGNEPSKEWCDKNINWFDGTQTIWYK